jgi:hypothetical protein
MADENQSASKDYQAILINLAKQARLAESDKVLQFLLVNQTHQLVPYVVGALWIEDEGIAIQSGVSFVERNSPYVQWLTSVCKGLAGQPACEIKPSMLSGEQVKEWDSYLPANAYWMPITGANRKAGLLLAGEQIFSESQCAYLNEWLEIWSYSWVRLDAPTIHGELTRLWIRVLGYLPTKEQVKRDVIAIYRGSQLVYQQYRLNPWLLSRQIRRTYELAIVQLRSSWQWFRKTNSEEMWDAYMAQAFAIWRDKKRRWKWLFWIFLLFPVRLTVLAPAELVPANPAIIRVPFEGIVDEFYVAPNQQVAKGQPLFKLDITSLLSRLHVAEQEIQIATQEYRQSALQGLTDSKSRGMLVPQEEKATEKKVEAEYLKSLLDKAKITAPRDGIALFDEPSEWIGKPVVAGEKVMVVASEGEVEIEAWIPVGDAIELPKKSNVTLYLNAMPFSPVSGLLRYEAHEPVQRPDGSYAYRVRANLPSGEQGPRVGLKGTAKVSGQFVPLSYWVLRKPLSSLRQFLGI